MMILLIAGIAILLAGLVAIGFGIPVHEFSFGNTLILAGTVAACTGILLLALSVVVREVKSVLGRITGAAGTALPEARQSPAIDHGTIREQPRDKDPTFGNMPEPIAREADSSVPVSVTDDPDTDASQAPGAADTAPAKPRRNLLFASSSRKERERAAAKNPDHVPTEPETPITSSSPAPATNAPSATFDDAWPPSERGRPDGGPPRIRTPSTFNETRAGPLNPDRFAKARSADQPPVTVLKSGVVDGMAYSLYSDGSIEAQMPEGMMRFASIDELRSHLDQRP